MLDKQYIRAIFTPEVRTPDKGFQPDESKAESVTIVGFTEDAAVVIFIDDKGNLRRGKLNQFKDCVFISY